MAIITTRPTDIGIDAKYLQQIEAQSPNFQPLLCFVVDFYTQPFILRCKPFLIFLKKIIKMGCWRRYFLFATKNLNFFKNCVFPIFELLGDIADILFILIPNVFCCRFAALYSNMN